MKKNKKTSGPNKAQTEAAYKMIDVGASSFLIEFQKYHEIFPRHSDEHMALVDFILKNIYISSALKLYLRCIGEKEPGSHNFSSIEDVINMISGFFRGAIERFDANEICEEVDAFIRAHYRVNPEFDKDKH